MTNRTAPDWLEQGLTVSDFSNEEIAEASAYTDEQDRLLAEGIAASEAGHVRPAMNSFLDFLERRERERELELREAFAEVDAGKTRPFADFIQEQQAFWREQGL